MPRTLFICALLFASLAVVALKVPMVLVAACVVLSISTLTASVLWGLFAAFGNIQ